jgi:hypothetical protein
VENIFAGTERSDSGSAANYWYTIYNKYAGSDLML